MEHCCPAQGKPLPLVSREGYRVALLAFTTLQHPEMLAVGSEPSTRSLLVVRGSN